MVREYLYELFFVKSANELSYLDVIVLVGIAATFSASLYAIVALVRYIRSIVAFKRMDKKLNKLLEFEENENREWQDSQKETE